MKFWAIANQYEEDVYYDFESESDIMGLEPTCLLPVEALATSLIECELSIDYVAVEIEVYRVEKNGTWSYTRGTVKRWDEEA